MQLYLPQSTSSLVEFWNTNLHHKAKVDTLNIRHGFYWYVVLSYLKFPKIISTPKDVEVAIQELRGLNISFDGWN